MSRPLRRASVWLARHPTVLVVAVVLTAAIVVGVVGDVAGAADTPQLADVEIGTSEVSTGDGGPNSVDDGD